MTPKDRIWELDAARGLCILCMVAVHLIYDLTELYPIINWKYPAWFFLLKNWGGTVFFLISGISATLGHHHLRRGLTVFGCAVLVSTVIVLAGFLPIRFGVLHCLGLCMLCWHIFRNFSSKMLFVFGIILSFLGFIVSKIRITSPYFYCLGLVSPNFESADFFPLLPYLGFFLLGACAGRRLYRKRRSLLPQFKARNPLRIFLTFCGRNSLPIYLIHQPVLILAIEVMAS